MRAITRPIAAQFTPLWEHTPPFVIHKKIKEVGQDHGQDHGQDKLVTALNCMDSNFRILQGLLISSLPNSLPYF